MGDDKHNARQQRRFIRLDVTEDVRAVDAKGRDIGRVEKVGAGGMQIRLCEDVSAEQYGPGTTMDVTVIEPGNVRNSLKVEVRVRDGNMLGVQFLT